MRMRYESTTEIATRPEEVWPVMTDVERWPDWLPTVASVQALDDGPPRPGVRYRLVQRRTPPAVWAVTVFAPAREFTWATRFLGARMTAEHHLEAAGGVTRVRLVLSLEGRAAPVLASIAGARMRRFVDIEATALKWRCEP
ncbi:SRPBCC family protein [Nocardiopsis suaedae]|uniref:SRPBCC family protein n=1 Tax=Nocardiopsis suaedae TaxID=3018444 RepID=A0ABT4TH66_9ACTN|nr:SRPBCC family protein [Nocardiopsis suaedae]MDA2804000.1 SRPBCC family protein [Nocardiopsis suaedae]